MKDSKRTLEYAAVTLPSPVAATSTQRAPSFDQLVGSSSAMRGVFASLKRASGTDATVLLQGETGTGKEATAEAVHRESPRRDRPFVVVDCGALPAQLMESELFGHEKGSFTGAVAGRPGAFEAAAGGTVFLDEIGELDIALQPKLLRALERRQIKRVGNNEYMPLDVRIIAATNRDLRKDVEAGKFRSDLFFRLAVVSVRLPPLRERPEDIPGLIAHILRSLRPPEDRMAPLRDPAFTRLLVNYPWPGNVRELRNHIESCLALGEAVPPGQNDGGAVPEALAGPGEITSTVDLPLKEAREACIRDFEQRYLAAVLHKNGDNVSAAARAAGMDRAHFYRLLWKHGIRVPEGRQDTPPPIILGDEHTRIA